MTTDTAEREGVAFEQTIGTIVQRRSQPELLAVARESHALDPAIFDEPEHAPFLWTATASNNSVDSYNTKMDTTSLKNYADDAKFGVAFMNSHRTGSMFSSSELPLGRSIDGAYTGPQGNGLAHTDVDFYTLRGLNLNGLSTDDFIRGVRSGVIHDVSIGFIPGEYRCSICERDMLTDLECWHVPGLAYTLRDEKGTVRSTDPVTAIAIVMNARLVEVSAVYKGSTPGASIIKARREAESGRLRSDSVSWLEQRYRIALPTAPRAFGGATPQKEDIMPSETDKKVETLVVDPLAEVRAVAAGFTDHGIEARDNPVEMIRAAQGELARLRPLADEGRAYRSDLIDAALAEGVRAHGADFAAEQYRTMLTAAPLETVKRMRDDWKGIGDKTFAGGRQSKDIEEPEPVTVDRHVTPDHAFRA